MPSIHQINHPGKELEINFKSRKNHHDDYYFIANSNNQGVRLWNRCVINSKLNRHKRKFMEHLGKYIKDIDNPIEELGILRFWGEYEGHSKFSLLDRRKNIPYWNNPWCFAMSFGGFCRACGKHRTVSCKAITTATKKNNNEICQQ